MRERRVLVKSFAEQYKKASKSKKKKGAILDRFVELHSYNRSYGALILRKQGLKLYYKDKRLVGDVNVVVERKRARKYGPQVHRALVKTWKSLDYLCGKRLAAILPETIPQLEKHGELDLTGSQRQLLFQISPPLIVS